MQTDNIVFNTVTPLGADCKPFAGGNISIGTQNFGKQGQIDAVYKPYVATVSQVTTVVATATASTAYSFTLSCFDTQQKIPLVISWTGYISDAVPTRTEIVTAAKAFIDGFANSSVTATLTGSGDNKDLVITSNAYFPYHTFDATGSTGVLTPTVSPAATQGFGAGATLLYFEPQLADKGIVAANNYDLVSISLANPALATYVNGVINQTLNVYVKTDATNVKTLIGITGSATAGYVGYGTLTAAVFNNLFATVTAVGANVAIASGVATRASGSFVTEKVKTGDVINIGTTPGIVYQPYTDGTTTTDLAFTKALVVGSDVSAAAATISQFTPLP